ncbi:flagellar hook protein FlgE [Gemmata sp. JC673]|uniref:Flagellar hook protein FlgE n=1 Tax=Gemmata algarum TaxID=2975278 RepID=A0ABU5EZ50_9BACT|nr:flagellar hook protein FlgE [Gemmata algarum]MDY3560514.1 flagellar hook protein FlgE [Gemmata algarum]
MSLNALFVGSSGLTTNSSALDLIGNNLANINTTGYKDQRMVFRDVVYQTLGTGTSASATTGGVNPSQIGFGVGVGSIGTQFTQGNLNPTGRSLDAGIQGRGFFVMRNVEDVAYTRAGAFGVDSAGYLVDPGTGYRVQRFGPVGEGGASNAGDPQFQVPGNLDIQIPFGTGAAGVVTSTIDYQGNLSSAMQVNEVATTAIQVYDAQSTARAVTVTFTKTAANTYSPSVLVSGADPTKVTLTGGPITFNSTGQLVGTANTPVTLTLTLAANALPGINTAQTITLNLGTAGLTNGLTQFGGATTVSATNQDGSGFGTLTDVSIDADGIIQGKFTNGRTINLAQLAIAGFNNEDGLLRTGSNYFRSSVASGEALIGLAGQGGRGSLQGGSLESSNVDIAIEFSRLIVAQRGFQVNARTISTTNDTLQELANIIR